MREHRWIVEHVARSLWIAYRADLEHAMIFRTQTRAMNYAQAGGVI